MGTCDPEDYMSMWEVYLENSVSPFQEENGICATRTRFVSITQAAAELFDELQFDDCFDWEFCPRFLHKCVDWETLTLKPDYRTLF